MKDETPDLQSLHYHCGCKIFHVSLSKCINKPSTAMEGTKQDAAERTVNHENLFAGDLQ